MKTASRPDGQQKKPSKLWTIVAWVVAVFFAFAALVALTSGSVGERIGGFFVSIAVAIPFAWVLYCRSRDKKAQENYTASAESEDQLQQILGNDYVGVTQAMAAVTPPTRKPRRWGWVAALSVLLLVIGSTLGPTPEPTQPVPAAEETTAPDTTTTSATPDREAEEERKAEAEREAKERAAEESQAKESEERAAKESESRKTEASEKRAAEESAARESERQESEEEAWERAAQAERDRVARDEAAAAEQEHIRNEQQPQQQFVPAPAPAPSASYKNCTDVWDRLGRPITPSDPGYTSGSRKLDGNSDGVGCETDPR